MVTGRTHKTRTLTRIQDSCKPSGRQNASAKPLSRRSQTLVGFNRTSLNRLRLWHFHQLLVWGEHIKWLHASTTCSTDPPAYARQAGQRLLLWHAAQDVYEQLVYQAVQARHATEVPFDRLSWCSATSARCTSGTLCTNSTVRETRGPQCAGWDLMIPVPAQPDWSQDAALLLNVQG